MSEPTYPHVTPEIARQRRETAAPQYQAFRAFSKQAMADGALDARTKQLIAVAAAHITQCPYCIDGHTRLALKAGATREQVMEAIWVAAEMRAGAAYAHSAIALRAMADSEKEDGN